MVLLTAGAVAALTLYNLDVTLQPIRLDRLTRDAERIANDVAQYTQGARADVKVLAGGYFIPAFANSAGATKPGDVATDAQQRERIAVRFLGELRFKPEYQQLRLIGTAEDGREVIRVDRLTKDGTPRIVPDAELQRKGDAAFFRDAIKVGAGNVYVSPVEFSRELGEISNPAVPVVRIAAPVVNADQPPFGVVIVNVDLRPIFARLLAFAPIGGTIRLVNADGEYLLHPDAGKSFRFEYGGSSRVQDEFPALTDLLAAKDGGTMVIKDRSGAPLVAAVQHSQFAGGTPFAVIETVPQARLDATTRPLRDATLVGGSVTAGFALIIAFLLARSISRPIEQITKAVEAFSDRKLVPMPVAEGGEIGELARALTRMADDVRDQSGQLQDEIAHHRRNEVILRQYAEQERLYTAVVESSNDAVIAKTLDGKITAWNHAAHRLFGYSAEDALGQSINLIVPLERRAEVRAVMERVTRGEHIEHHETQRRAKDGRLIDVSLSISPIRSPSGEIIGAAKIIRDFTQQNLAEANFRLALEASPSGVLMVDQDGKIVLANAETKRLFGYLDDELIGLTVESLVPARYRGHHDALRDTYFESPSARAMGQGRELYGMRKDGSEFPIEIGLSPIESQQGLFVLAAVTDISARKREAAAIAHYTDELRRSNVELEQFAYVASHDLQEPLRMVASFTQLLAERYHGKLDDKANQYIEYAVDGAKRMQGLVRDLLHYSRVAANAPPRHPVDTAAVLKLVMTNLSAAVAESHAEIVTGALPEIAGDDTELSQVFQNLVANAIKFRSERPLCVTIDARRENAGWLFWVQDNGIGIDAKHQDRIFQMFQRLHQRGKYQGNGIGLAIVKKIVERHGGRIWFESSVGQGTTFYFTIPDDKDGFS